MKKLFLSVALLLSTPYALSMEDATPTEQSNTQTIHLSILDKHKHNMSSIYYERLVIDEPITTVRQLKETVISNLQKSDTNFDSKDITLTMIPQSDEIVRLREKLLSSQKRAYCNPHLLIEQGEISPKRLAELLRNHTVEVVIKQKEKRPPKAVVAAMEFIIPSATIAPPLLHLFPGTQHYMRPALSQQERNLYTQIRKKCLQVYPKIPLELTEGTFAYGTPYESIPAKTVVVIERLGRLNAKKKYESYYSDSESDHTSDDSE